MKKQFYKTLQLSSKDTTYRNKIFYVDYYILENRISLCKGGYEKVYGVSVTKHYIDIAGNSVVQEESVCAVTQSEDEIYRFAQLLERSKALPGELSRFTFAAELVSDTYETENAV